MIDVGGEICSDFKCVELCFLKFFLYKFFKVYNILKLLSDILFKKVFFD